MNAYRDPALAHGLAHAIVREAAGRDYALMEFCGGHTHATSRHGIEDLLPRTVRMIHGPGCPVCVLPIGRLDMAIALAARPNVTLASYGDMLRVPGSGGRSLLKAKAEGADVRMVYSPLQAVALAEQRPDREIVFFAVGFETTTPPTALALRAARAKGLKNFSVLCNHVLTPAAIRAIMESGEAPELDGFVGPGHVSTIIGADAYAPAARAYAKPIVIAGFEPVDVLDAVLRLVRQVNRQSAEVENAYARAAPSAGNAAARAAMAEAFALRPSFAWRGLGEIPESALKLGEAYAAFDAEARFALEAASAEDHKACACGDILRGQKRPADCKVIATACTPDHPLGACMVSSEGACAAHYLYGRFRERERGVSAGRKGPFPRGLDLARGALDMTHGPAARASAQLFQELILPALANPALAAAEDQGRLAVGAERLAFSTDAYVVTPLFFPGGDIGKLAVHGTINDLAMAGAEPLALSLSLIAAEGTPLALLQQVLESVGAASREAGVPVITGDTKVVEAGRADPLYLVTSGVGRIPAALAEPPAAARIRTGDVILVSGTLGDHGVAVLCARGEMPIQAEVRSDTAALHGLVAALRAAAPVRALRDPTRGGLSATLNEFAWTAGLGA